MNHENLTQHIKASKTIAVNMCKNTITLDGIEHSVPNVQFNCNWVEQNNIELIRERVLNSSCDLVKMKTDDGSLSLPIKESILFKTNLHEIMSVGFYRIALDGEI